MKKAPLPYQSNPNPQPDDEQGFHDFLDSVGFRQKLADQHYPEKNAGAHVPVWVTPNLAKQLLAQHGRSGHVIPHQNDNL